MDYIRQIIQESIQLVLIESEKFIIDKYGDKLKADKMWGTINIPVSEYKTRVKDSVVQIIVNERSISEKSFSLYDEVISEVAEFFKNNEQANKIILECEKTDKRPEYCAEYIYGNLYSVTSLNEDLIKDYIIEKIDFPIYTIGNEENYDELMEERPLYKSKGGSAWKTYSAVLKYFNKINGKVLVDNKEMLPAAIYEMEGIWESDVEEENSDYGILNKKLKIIKKVTSEKLNEAKKSKFSKLEDNKIPLTPEERKIVMDADAIWHHGLNGAPSPAVWKSKDKNGKITYVTNTHRAYQDRPTLKGPSVFITVLLKVLLRKKKAKFLVGSVI